MIGLKTGARDPWRSRSGDARNCERHAKVSIAKVWNRSLNSYRNGWPAFIAWNAGHLLEGAEARMRTQTRKRIATKAGKALRERAAKERKRRKAETLTANPIWKKRHLDPSRRPW
jgi:hypothetical protein